MQSESNLQLPESHLNILRIVSAIAWADGKLSEAELNVIIHGFDPDLPASPSPLLYLEDPQFLFGTSVERETVSKQLSERISAELALKEVIMEYKYNPLPLKVLVDKLATQEDRCLALKLAYMVIKASPNESGQLINMEEKKAYRQLVDLLNLEEDLVREIELQADGDLEKFQHPLQAFLDSLKKALGMS
jgi:hypothetical protein